MAKLLVLGVGNLLLTDDGVGVMAAQELMQNTWPAHVCIQEAGTFTHDIFYKFEGYSHILVLDVVRAKGTPGTIYRLTEDALIKNESQRLSLHDIDLIDSLQMAERLFTTRPSMLILGMEPYDHSTWNIGLSKELQAHFPNFVKTARQEIEQWIQEHDEQKDFA